MTFTLRMPSPEIWRGAGGLYSSFELQLLVVEFVWPVLCAVVYRPPKYNSTSFLRTFSQNMINS